MNVNDLYSSSAGKNQKRWAEISFMRNFTSDTTRSGAAAWVRRREAGCCSAWPASSRWSRVTTLRWEIWLMSSVKSLVWTQRPSNPLSMIYWRLLSFRVVIMSDPRTFMESARIPLISLGAHANYICLRCQSSCRLCESLSPYLVSAGCWSVPREPWGSCSARTTEWACV